MSNESVGAVLVVYNPVKVDQNKLRESVSKHAPPSCRIEWVKTHPENEKAGEISVLSRPDIALVLVAGGDGTVRLIASALAGTGISLGVIPVGTGNLLARNLGMDLGLDASVKRAFKGVDRGIDVCRAKLTRPDGTVDCLGFTVMAGLGLDTGMLENTDERLKKRVGPLAYGQGILRSLAKGSDVSATYTIDGEEKTEATLNTMIFGNCGCLINDFPLLPEAKPDDGVFDVITMAPRGPLGWLNVFGWIGINAATAVVRKLPGTHWVKRSRKRNHLLLGGASMLRYARGKRAAVEFSQPHIFELDGDPVGHVVSLVIEVEPKALLVRV
ncbi:diacylglycerol/lipid kinase family protein [Corynebacterium mayonis]|uniref:diacylglycerol/lipid kinase family protein n=1 Tax=Corynebacterium mayonis TaxID=3062461 RepID=UPI0031408EB1